MKSVAEEKSRLFALRIIKLYKYLIPTLPPFHLAGRLPRHPSSVNGDSHRV